LPASTLNQLTGKYDGPSSGTIVVTSDPNVLKLQAGDFQATLFAESESIFFLKERDVVFEFQREGKKVVKIIVHENGNVVEEAKKILTK